MGISAPARRFVGIWHPHGASPGYWSPLQEGKNFEFSFITKPLEVFRNRVVLISGLDMPEAMATTDEPGGDQWITVTRVVTDPTYLTMPFITSESFKKEPDGAKWHPTPCDVEPPRQ